MFRIIAILLILLSVSKSEPFLVGERLEFSLWFNFVKSGSAVMEIRGKERIGEKEAYHFYLSSESNPFFDRIFKVRDFIHSWADPVTLVSYRFQKKIEEGRYKRFYSVNFDYKNKKAISNRAVKDLDKKVFDPVSIIYRVRQEDLGKNKAIRLEVFDNDRIKNFNMNVSRKETVTVPAGVYNCFVLEPASTGEKLYKQQVDMTIYITDDSLRLPVLISTTSKYGKMVFKLEKYLIKK